VKKQGWFTDWFDTEYYHLLYRNRDDNEASKFIRSIVDFIQLDAGVKVADIACGKGRHSRVLAGMGFHVHGFDLSENNILYARKHASGNEEFTIHDIREPYGTNGIAAAFNLFTSFGYFETRSEDIDALKNIFDILEPAGFFVQDYINGPPVIKKLPHHYEEKCSGVEFKIEKSWKPPFVVKKILVSKANNNSEFMEKVKLYKVEEMTEMHVQCGFEVVDIFGSYDLSEYDSETSPRMILVSRKPNA
jgi:2-polyprenyl-3-methyl-5-hydroxy-6-metoxy-1,4-benzoquinol methylase